MQSLLTTAAMDMDITPALAHFAEHGYATLGCVASDHALEHLRARTDDLMLGRVTHEGLFFQLDTDTGDYNDLVFGRGYEGPNLNYRKIEKLEKDPVFCAWLENALFERIARTLIQGEIAIYRAIVMNKSAQGGSVLPWHQDGGKFWGLDRDPVLQIWTALDDVPLEAGAVEVVPGTHKDGLASPLGGLVQKDNVARRRADETALALPARAGEAILLHNYVWHRSGVNQTGAPRRAFSTCYMSAATRCLRKKRSPRTFVRVFGT